MLLPDDKLKVKLKVSCINICDGSIVIKIETVNNHSEKVLEGYQNCASNHCGSVHFHQPAFATSRYGYGSVQFIPYSMSYGMVQMLIF
jgi:hypothetical protein